MINKKMRKLWKEERKLRKTDHLLTTKRIV